MVERALRNFEQSMDMRKARGSIPRSSRSFASRSSQTGTRRSALALLFVWQSFPATACRRHHLHCFVPESVKKRVVRLTPHSQLPAAWSGVEQTEAEKWD